MVHRVGWRRGAATRSEEGMVSAELALALPALLAVVLALAWVVGLGASQGLVQQAAREGARAAARGESASQVRGVVAHVLPGAQATVRPSGGEVVVTVTLERTPPVRLLRPLSRRLTATATGWREVP